MSRTFTCRVLPVIILPFLTWELFLYDFEHIKYPLTFSDPELTFEGTFFYILHPYGI